MSLKQFVKKKIKKKEHPQKTCNKMCAVCKIWNICMNWGREENGN